MRLICVDLQVFGDHWNGRTVMSKFIKPQSTRGTQGKAFIAEGAEKSRRDRRRFGAERKLELAGLMLPLVVRNEDTTEERELRLAFTNCYRALQRIDVPQAGFCRQLLYSDFSLHFGTGLAAPDNAKLCVGPFVLEIENVSRFELGFDALQRSAASTNRAQTGGQGEGLRVGIEAPDTYGQVHENSLLATPIHETSSNVLRNRRLARRRRIGNSRH